jgi:DNA-binding NarL/FixJ family response regulator
MANTTTRPIRLLIVDDHVMFREGLTRMFEREPDLKVMGQCASVREALSALKTDEIDVVLLDVNLGTERAIEFLTAARRRPFTGKILILTAGISEQEAVLLVQAGVAGILHKHHSTAELCQSIRKVANGDVYLEPQYMAPLFRASDRSRTATLPQLTERDRTVLRLILQGLTNREIAARVEVSEGTVKASLRQVFGKLGVRTRAQAVKVALEQFRDQL